jgi:hypothetical protein
MTWQSLLTLCLMLVACGASSSATVAPATPPTSTAPPKSAPAKDDHEAQPTVDEKPEEAGLPAAAASADAETSDDASVEKSGRPASFTKTEKVFIELGADLRCGPSGVCPQCQPLKKLLTERVDSSDVDSSTKLELQELINKVSPKTSCPPPGPHGPRGGCSKCAPAQEFLKRMLTGLRPGR